METISGLDGFRQYLGGFGVGCLVGAVTNPFDRLNHTQSLNMHFYKPRGLSIYNHFEHFLKLVL